eukprot:COSAG01_NODE_19991_length_977_cov_2.186788_2_plen_119_part_00
MNKKCQTISNNHGAAHDAHAVVSATGTNSRGAYHQKQAAASSVQARAEKGRDYLASRGWTPRRDCPRRAELTSTAMPSFITVTEPSGDTCWMEMLPAAVNVVDVIESPCLGNGYTATQ